MIRWLGVATVIVVMLHGATAWAGSVSQPISQSSFGALAVDDINQHVFVSSPTGNAVIVYDFNGNYITTISDIYGAYGMVIDGSTLYVAESTAGAIDAIDLATLKDQGTLATGLIKPQWLAYAGGKLWTTVGDDCQSCQIASVGLSGGVTVFPTSYYEPDLAASAGDPDTLYLAEDGLSPGAILKLDVSSGSPVVAASNPQTYQENLDGLAVSPDGTRVIPASGYPYEFEELSASTLTADGIIYPGDAYPVAVAVSPGDGGLVATGLEGYDTPDISVFPLGTPSAIFTASTSPSETWASVMPHGLALSADGSRLFAVTADNVYDNLFHFWTFNTEPTVTTTTVGVDQDPATLTHTATLTASVGPTDGGGSVSFQSNATAISGCSDVPLVSDSDNGTATCTTSSLSAGSDTITAIYSGDFTDANSSGSTDITVNYSDATTAQVSLSPSSLFADGDSTTTATATVADTHGDPVAGDAVAFTVLPAGAATVGPVIDNGDGTYTATITSSNTIGRVTVKATDSSTSAPVSGSAYLSETSDPAVTVGVKLASSSIVADGTATTTATVTVLDPSEDPVNGQAVSLYADPAESVVIGPVTDNGDGTYSATITAATTTGPVTITAEDYSTAPAASGSATFAETAGAATSVSVWMAPSRIVANGTSTTTATATVLDAEGHRVDGETVSFSADPAGAASVGAVTDNGDGTYSATITSSTSLGQATITATDRSVTPSPSGDATLTEIGGPAASVSVALEPATVVASGTSTTTATATVLDAQGRPVPGDWVTFSADPSDGAKIGAVTDHGDGTYTATITSSTTAGQVTITATDRSTSPVTSTDTTLTETAGPAASVTIGLTPATLYAGDTSSTIATATVLYARGNPVSGDRIVFSAEPSDGVEIGAVTDHGNGTYSAILTSSTVRGSVNITATDASASLSGSTTLTENSCPSVNLRLRLDPSKIVANGTSTTRAITTVRDGHGKPVTGDEIELSAKPAADVTIGRVTDNHDGTYTATVASSTIAGAVKITATDDSTSPAGCAALDRRPATSELSLTSLPGAASQVSPAAIRSSLAEMLAPRGPAAKIRSILRHGSYSFAYSAPAAGKLTVGWYHRSGARQIRVASAARQLSRSGRFSVAVRLTQAGRAALAHADRLQLRSQIGFTPADRAQIRRSGRFTLR